MGTIRLAATADDFAAFGSLVREYVASLPFELDFQDIDQELSALRDAYGPPGGAALLVEMAGTEVGCVGIQPFDPPEIGELKRMFVRPEARGHGLGRALVDAALETAAGLGYERLRLDTVAELVEAAELYRTVGFVEIEPYRYNPVPSARFYETVLGGAGSR